MISVFSVVHIAVRHLRFGCTYWPVYQLFLLSLHSSLSSFPLSTDSISLPVGFGSTVWFPYMSLSYRDPIYIPGASFIVVLTSDGVVTKKVQHIISSGRFVVYLCQA